MITEMFQISRQDRLIWLRNILREGEAKEQILRYLLFELILS